ncbi:MAG: trypsin-like peptidase domain-containing protein [Kiritimatiellae bacterium]|nr:trypsin-like peptidase domain-containing protein [Kiritimatiellia bacterium]
MMWWIRRNGHVEGPFSDDDMRKRITLNMIGSLDRVSTNKQRWQYLKDTELWRPQKNGAGSISLAESPSTAIDWGRPISAPQTVGPSRSVSTSSVPIPERRRMPEERVPPKTNRALFFALCGGVAAVLVVSLVAIVVMLSSRFSAGKESAITAAAPSTAGFEAVRDAVALIECKEASGTGFLLDMDGKTYLMSNEHVLRSGGKIEARLIDGTLLRLGEFSVAADGRDLARFEVLGCNKKPLHLRETMPSIGEQVTVYGNSLGGGVATESKGFIQGVGPTKIETNAEIVHGNSGSPLLDVNNVVVGVAALIEYTGKKDWGNMGTRYDGKVRRYAVRLTGVNWKAIDRSEYEKQVREFAEVDTFLNYLLPFIFLETGKVAEEKLVYNDLCSKAFSMRETGFNDMMKEIAKKYERSGKAIARLAEWEKGRKELIRRLGLEIDSKQLAKDAAKKTLSEYDEKMIKAYEKMKEECRGMILIRKEALNHAQIFLSGRTWDAPQIEKGYDDDPRDSVNAYREVLSKCIDLMNQAMKNLNKTLKELEEGDDDENN